jgi:hypothetical protein
MPGLLARKLGAMVGLSWVAVNKHLSRSSRLRLLAAAVVDSDYQNHCP